MKGFPPKKRSFAWRSLLLTAIRIISTANLAKKEAKESVTKKTDKKVTLLAEITKP